MTYRHFLFWVNKRNPKRDFDGLGKLEGRQLRERSREEERKMSKKGGKKGLSPIKEGGKRRRKSGL